MTDHNREEREELIEEAAKAMVALAPGETWEDCEQDWYIRDARAAFAVFEQAHTPTSDEREVLEAAFKGHEPPTWNEDPIGRDAAVRWHLRGWTDGVNFARSSRGAGDDREVIAQTVKDVATKFGGPSMAEFATTPPIRKHYATADAILAAGFRRTVQGGTEWEYGNEMLMNNHTQIYPASSEFMAKAQAWLWPMYRRRKAGPWVPVEQDTENRSER